MLSTCLDENHTSMVDQTPTPFHRWVISRKDFHLGTKCASFDCEAHRRPEHHHNCIQIHTGVTSLRKFAMLNAFTSLIVFSVNEKNTFWNFLWNSKVVSNFEMFSGSIFQEVFLIAVWDGDLVTKTLKAGSIHTATMFYTTKQILCTKEPANQVKTASAQPLSRPQTAATSIHTFFKQKVYVIKIPSCCCNNSFLCSRICLQQKKLGEKL